jgi:diaminopimelate decarboxylase
MSIPRATLTRHYTVLREAVDAHPALGDAADRLRGEGQLQPVGAGDPGRLGCGADTVSEGEIRRALAAGVPPSGSSSRAWARPTPNWPSPSRPASPDQRRERPELDLIARRQADCVWASAPIAIRVNPTAAGGHAKITTGKADDKFGVPFAEAHRPLRPRRRLAACDARSAWPATSAARSPTWPHGGRLPQDAR